MPDAKRTNQNYLKLGEAVNFTGMCAATLRAWANQGVMDHYFTPTGHRMFNKEGLIALTRGICPPSQTQKDIIYCRVSSKKQENDLARQVQHLRSAYPDFPFITDIASGINWKRKGL